MISKALRCGDRLNFCFSKKMITVYHYTRLPDLAEVVSNKSLDGLGNAVAFLINEAMKIKQEPEVNAKTSARTETLSSYANGFKPKQKNTSRCETTLEAIDDCQIKFELLHFNAYP